MGLAPKSGVKCMGIQTKGLFCDARLLELSHERLQEKLKLRDYFVMHHWWDCHMRVVKRSVSRRENG